jgi:hypothetical protein
MHETKIPLGEKVSNGHSPQIRQNGELLVRMCRGESHCQICQIRQTRQIRSILAKFAEASHKNLLNTRQIRRSESQKFGKFLASTRIR